MAAGVVAGSALPSSTEDLLWRSPLVYERRREKLEHAREALRLAFGRRPDRTAAETELIDFLEREALASDPAAQAVWSDPAAYHWVRTLYDLTAAVFGGAEISPAAASWLRDAGTGDPLEGLELLADDHKLFDVAIAHRRGTDLRLGRPWEGRLPLAIPASTRVLASADGTGRVRIGGVRAGEVLATPVGDGPPPSWQARPVVVHDGVELRLVPEAFDRPGMDLGPALRALPAGYQDENADYLQRAIEAVARHHPATLEHCRAMMRLVALKPPTDEQITNFSHSDFPGAMALGVSRHPEWLADSFIHEVHHSRLFYVEEGGRLFADEIHNLLLDSSYYSPWREDLRPLHGIFHAVYVHLPLWHFWRDVHRTRPDEGALAASRLLHVLLQLEIGVGQLRRHARFTPFGQELFDAMAREVDELRAQTRASGLDGGVPAMTCDAEGRVGACKKPDGSPWAIRDLVSDHVRRFDVSRQCGDFASPPGIS